jgi:hypothetical protein
VAKKLMAASATPSVVFRAIAAHRPTLLIDEAAGMFDDAGELRRVLNSGYRFDGAVLRNVGDSFEPRLFAVFAPVAFALTGMLPADLHSRCICVNLQRKLASEKVEEYRIAQMQHLDALARKIVRWVGDNADAIVGARPAMPPSVVNRSSDLWAVMLSVAVVAGGDWPQRVEQAITASLRFSDDDSTLFEQLITDIHLVFDEKGDKVSPTAMVEALAYMEGRPWGEMGKSHKPLTTHRLARMLRVPGVSVSSRQVDGGKARAYVREQFDDIFARYLPPVSAYYPPKRHSVTNPMKTEENAMTLGGDTSQTTSEASCAIDASTDAGGTGIGSVMAEDPIEIGVYDAMTLPRVICRHRTPLLPGMLEPARVRQLIDWWRKQAKALRAEMSPATLQSYLKQKLRETLAEELVADLVDDTATKIARAAKPKAKTRRTRR